MRASQVLAVALSTVLLAAVAPAVATAQTTASALQPTQAAAALTDTDGDGLPDTWETNGYDADGDGKIDVDLKAMGADPKKKDIFVETDYLTGQFPGVGVYDKIVAAMANLPVSNPNGTTGINIHLDAGSAGGSKYNLGGGGEIKGVSSVSSVSTVQSAKSKNMAAARDSVFHYMWWVDKYGSGSSSGQAALPGDTLMVAMGKTYWSSATEDMKASTFVHELGHNLGLHHGGSDDLNYKPNYLSNMNYRYQMSGVPLANGGFYYGYSNSAISINEGSLDESKGLGAAAKGFKTTYVNGNGKVVTSGEASGSIDWNGNGKIDAGSVSVDLNNDGSKGSLTGFNDIATLKLKVGDIGTAQGVSAKRSAPLSEVSTNEMTAELYATLSNG